MSRAKKRTRPNKTKVSHLSRKIIYFFSASLAVALFVAVIIFLPKDTTKAEGTTVTPVGQTGSWNLIFEDEFNGTELDATKWIKCREWGAQGEPCQTNTTPNSTYLPENVIVQNGIVRLQAQKGSFVGSNGRTYPYSSGVITTANYWNDSQSMRFTHTYGYMEARIKVPKSQGLWPAFWALPADGSWPPELDVMEILTGNGNTTSTTHMHYHYTDTTGVVRDSGGSWTSPVDLANDYHIYALSWEPNAVRWYVDGVERRAAFGETASITAKKMFLLLDLQVGGNWPGNPDETTVFPNYMDIDYVRVWQKAAAPTATNTPQPTVAPTATPSATPTPMRVPTLTPTPTKQPTATPTPVDTTPPNVVITAPVTNTTVSRNGSVWLYATATDNIGVQRVEFYVNGSYKCTDTTSAPYSCKWNVPSQKNAQYSITAKAWDNRGNVATSPVVKVTAK